MNMFGPVQYAKILYEVTKDLEVKDLDTVLSRFVLLVKKNRASKKMPEIIAAFESYTRAQEGWVDLNISSAKKLSPSVREKIYKQFGAKVTMELEQDVSLIGGLAIRTQDKIFDASIKTQLQKMKEILLSH